MNKVLHIMLAGPVSDGWSYQDNMITKYHKRMGYDVTMITSQWIWGENGELKKYEKTNYRNCDDVKVIRLPIKGKDDFTRKLKRFKNLNAAIRDERPNIIFIHNLSFLDIMCIVKYLKKNPHIKVYVDNHSDFSNSGSNWFSRFFLHKLIWRAMAAKIEPHTVRFYGVLPARVNWLVDMYNLPKQKCELLLMGADDEILERVKKGNKRKTIRDTYNILDNEFLIVTGGKIDQAKKQTLLLLESVKNFNYPGIKVIVFGSIVDSLKDELGRLCDNSKIIYAGWITSEESYSYFEAADLVVFPGRHSVFWEQVAGQGLPMVCKYWEGTTHVNLGGNVKFLYEDSVEEITGVLTEIMANNKELYYRMKKQAKNVKNSFLYSTIAQQAIERKIYE